ncbi:MAG: hypothetical protein JG718_03805 [Candidatus Thiothrix moscowensis]|nr:hypothetical protein [Candidatus Thiothrix moscowensis]
MMKQPDDDKLRKANLRVAIILGAIALLAMAYSFVFLPKVLSGGVVP